MSVGIAVNLIPQSKARTYNSGFPEAALTYHGLSTASDGNVYYALSTEVSDVGARMFRCEPTTGKITCLGDLTEACGEKGLDAVVQGKCHTNFHELDGKLYFSTHLGFYRTDANGREYPGIPPAGVKPYPGGHFLSYKMDTGEFENLAIAPDGEGIIAVALDTQRKILFGLTWPTGFMLRYNLTTKKLDNLGATSMGGEKGDPPYYRTLCRALALDPDTGNVYLSVADGTIVSTAGDSLTKLTSASLDSDILGDYNVAVPGELAYNWRQTVHYEPANVFYAVHGRTGFLVRLDPGTGRLQFIHRIVSDPTNSSGMFDVERHGYLSFKIGPDGETIFFLTGAHINETKTQQKQENIHLVTYHIPAAEYIDRGAVFLDTGGAPSGINAIAIDKNQNVYTLSWINEGGKTRYDLISFLFDHNKSLLRQIFRP